MALIFLGVLNRFYRFKFRVLPSKIALTSLPMMSGPIQTTSIHWIIRFGGNAGVLSQAATKAKQFLSLKVQFR